MPSSGTVSMTVAVLRSVNVTLPVGKPEPGATTETTAVKVTDYPAIEGATDGVSVIAVFAADTICSMVSRLGANALSPE